MQQCHYLFGCQLAAAAGAFLALSILQTQPPQPFNLQWLASNMELTVWLPVLVVSTLLCWVLVAAGVAASVQIWMGKV
jgi:hypothetical protein